jgi:hypothetical protein
MLRTKPTDGDGGRMRGGRGRAVRLSALVLFVFTLVGLAAALWSGRPHPRSHFSAAAINPQESSPPRTATGAGSSASSATKDQPANVAVRSGWRATLSRHPVMVGALAATLLAVLVVALLFLRRPPPREVEAELVERE